MDEQPNVEEEESSTKTLQSDFVSDYAPVLDDSSSLVEPVLPIAAKIDDTVVPEAETVGEPLAAAEEGSSGDAEVLGDGAETLIVGKEEDELDGGASGSELVGVATAVGAVEGVELGDFSEVEALLPCLGSVEQVDKEVEAKGRVGLLEVVESAMTEDERMDVKAKVEDDENGAEVVEEVLNFGVKRESDEPVEDSLPVESGNGGIEAMVEQEKDEIKANDEAEDEDIKGTEKVEKDESKAAAKVEEDEVMAIEEAENDDEIKFTEEVENEKDEIEAMQDEGDEIKAMEEEIEGHEIKTMEEEVEKDEVEAMEQVEKDETMAKEDVENGDGEGESFRVEDDMDLVSIKKDGEGESVAADDDEDEPLAVAEEDVLEVEMKTPESVKSTGGGKRKRGKNLKVSTTRSPGARKTIEEDVCFICFDGGDLVLCDRRGCPKAYHPNCVNRDEAFFQAKGRWNCGWHLCSVCAKDASYFCYTCTFSLCKACIKDAVLLCVRRNRGFCETCMKTVMLVENKEQENNEEPVDFNDKSSWEFLFNDYWTDLKAKLSLSVDELAQAKNPWKGSELASKQEFPPEQFDVKDEEGSGSDNSAENIETSKKKRRKNKKRAKSIGKEADSSTAAVAVGAEGNSNTVNAKWATEELLEFVMHMKNGDRSVLSQFDVQALLLKYIQNNKLRDSRRKSQIICDARLENLFGKPRVAHFEMLKLLESHFLIKEDSPTDDVQGSVVDTEASQMDDDETAETLTKSSKDRKRKMRKKGDGRGPHFNREDYAAIDINNISLIYLRRKLVEDLLEDTVKFQDKVVGTFVRIRIAGTNQKQELYRLVQVVGTSKAAEPYRLGKRTADIMLEILNLNKTEVVSIDTISNQEFTEDECKRLRQSIKCGLINRLTVGDILDKAMEVQSTRVNDWLETEVVRLSHLRDRASDMGHKKELRECIEKLQLLKTPEERCRRLEEVPMIHADPKMDPSYESEDDTDDGKKQEIHTTHRSSSFSRRGQDSLSPGTGDVSSRELWRGTTKNSSKNRELSRNVSYKGFSPKVEDDTSNFGMVNDNSWNQGRDNLKQQSNSLENPSSATGSGTSPTIHSGAVAETSASINETDKMWRYKDPSGKIQGPFSMVQLRKWSNSGYFPVDLRIWRITGKEDDGILLTDALAGRLTSLEQRREGQDEQSLKYDQSRAFQMTPSGDQSSRTLVTPSVELPRLSTNSHNDSANLPSPTPKQSSPVWTGGEVGPKKGASSFLSGNGGLQSPTPDSAQLAHSSIHSSVNQSGTSVPILQDSSNSHSAFAAAPNHEQGVHVGSMNSLQTSQSGHLAAAPDNNMAAQMVQSLSIQNPTIVSHGWNSAPPPSLQPNSTMNVPGQMVAYNHWAGVQSMVQNPPGTFPQPDLWGQAPVPGQPNMQQPQQPPNVAWGQMPGNPNMGWVGPAPGNPTTNWGAMVQGPGVPGNVNPTWVMPTGNPGGNVQVQQQLPGNVHAGWVAAPPGNPNPPNQGWVAAPSGIPGAPVQGMLPNQGWVAAPTQGQVVQMNGNPGWGMPAGNQGANVQGQAPGNTNPGWGPQTGNQGGNAQGPAPGNANQGWGSAAGNQGWGNEKQHNGDGQRGGRGSQGRDSGFRGKRQWNKDKDRNRDRDRDGDRRPSFGRGGPRGDSRSSEQTICPYYPNGRCNLGSKCRFLHT